MKIVVDELISWQYCLIILVILLFIIYLFFGGRNDVDYVGLKPLQIWTDAVTQKSHIKSSEEEENESSSSSSEEIIEKVPQKEENVANIISFKDSYEMPLTPIFDDLSIQFPEKELVPCEFSVDDLKSPRSLALGEFKCYKNNKPSKGEALCKQAIEDIYGAPFFCVRPDFLKNPETGRNLELDLYNDFYKVAVEYSGKQHYVYPNTFHKTQEEFIKQVRRDEFKVEMCDKHGIYLITVPHTVKNDYDEIRKYIEYYLPENHAKRLQDENVKD